MIVAATPSFAKGTLVQIGLSGGDLRREIRISASNADFGSLRSVEPPAEIPTVRPYLMRLYIDIGNEIVAPPPFEYFPGIPAFSTASPRVHEEGGKPSTDHSHGS